MRALCLFNNLINPEESNMPNICAVYLLIFPKFSLKYMTLKESEGVVSTKGFHMKMNIRHPTNLHEESIWWQNEKKKKLNWKFVSSSKVWNRIFGLSSLFRLHMYFISLWRKVLNCSVNTICVYTSTVDVTEISVFCLCCHPKHIQYSPVLIGFVVLITKGPILSDLIQLDKGHLNLYKKFL